MVSVSEDIAKALVKIQKKLKPLTKSETNDEYDSSYVPLEDVMAYALRLLNKEGIAISQPVHSGDEGMPELKTILIHESGETFETSTRLVLGKEDPQGHASAITYMRRYALMSVLGITAKNDDDDGNGAKRHRKPSKEQGEELVGLLRHLKWPAEQIKREVARAKTRDTISLMIHNYRQVVSDKLSRIEEAQRVEVSKEEDESVLTAFQNRLDALNLKSKSYENKIVQQATGRPFLAAVKTREQMQKLDEFLKFVEADSDKLPTEFYARNTENSNENE